MAMIGVMSGMASRRGALKAALSPACGNDTEAVSVPMIRTVNAKPASQP